MSAANLDRFSRFLGGFDALIGESGEDEPALLADGAALLGGLVRTDDWLPDPYARPHPQRYQQYLLYRDPAARFSVVSFVWGPGQATPVHNHTVWGLVGVLRGAELSQSYALDGGGLRPSGPMRRLEPGQVEAVSPRIGDVHRVANAFDDRTSISIHVYGADIGAVARSVFDDEGRPKRFVSGYAPAPPLHVDRPKSAAIPTLGGG
jgi:predicted metal-dependent enzyme (double-stranded beta helix superfamily)